MKLWTKSKFDLSDANGFREMVTDTWGEDAAHIMLNEVRFPIQITNCDRNDVYAFTDANGREYNTDVFCFPSDEYLFSKNDRLKFFKKVNYNSNPVTAEPVQEKNDAQQLLDCAHLLGTIYVSGKLVSKPGDLEKFLRKNKESCEKEMGRKLADANTTAEQCLVDLKLLRGEL